MTRVKSASGNDVRAILCLAFEPHAALDETKTFERFVIDRSEVLHAVETEGSFDFMIEARFEGMAEYHEFTSLISSRFPHLFRKKKASFVCRRFISGEERSVWIHHSGGRVRVDLNKVDRVMAEGDYVSLHIGQQAYLHHSTMHALEAALDPARFIRVHRSAILRLTSIDRVQRIDGGWVAQCLDGSMHRVAKGHAEELIKRLGARSSTNGRASVTFDEVAERPVLSAVD